VRRTGRESAPGERKGRECKKFGPVPWDNEKRLCKFWSKAELGLGCFGKQKLTSQKNKEGKTKMTVRYKSQEIQHKA